MFLTEQTQKRERERKKIVESCDENSSAAIFLKLFSLYDGKIKIKQSVCASFFLH